MNKRIAKKIVKYSACPKIKNNIFIKRFYKLDGEIKWYTKEYCSYRVFPYTKGQVHKARQYYHSFGHELPPYYYISESLVACILEPMIKTVNKEY